MSITPQDQQQQMDWGDILPSPNKQRMRELVERRKHQFRPDEELDNTDPKVEIGLNILGYTAAFLQIFFLLPWYMTDWTDKKVTAVYKSEYAIPGALTLQLLGVPGSGLYGMYLGITLVWIRFFPWLIMGKLGIMQGRYIKWMQQVEPYGGAPEDVASHVPDDRYIVPYQDSYNFGGDVDPMPTLRKDRSLLALGESRSGKTTALKSLVAQWRVDGSTAIIAHGSKGEYREFFGSLGIPIQAVIGPESSTRWNLFREVPDDATGRRRRDWYRDIAEVLVPVEGTDPYWDQSAQRLFADICMVVEEENENPHHGHLLTVLDGPSEIYDMLKDHGFDGSAQKIYDDDGNLQDEWGNFDTKISSRFRWLFGEAGDFSFREYFENPTGAIIIETKDDTGSIADTYASMCKFAVTWGLKKPPETQMLLDEVDSIGKIPNLDTAASEGNKNDLRLLVGIQSVGQLETVYNDDLSGVLSNLQQTIGLAPGTDVDDTDVDYLQSVVGERDELARNESQSHNPGQAASGLAGMIGAVAGSQTEGYSEERRSPIQPSEMKSWTEGEGIVSNMSGWYHIQWSHPDVIPELHDRRGAVEIEIDSAQDDHQQQQTWDADGSRSSDDDDDQSPLEQSYENVSNINNE